MANTDFLYDDITAPPPPQPSRSIMFDEATPPAIPSPVETAPVLAANKDGTSPEEFFAAELAAGPAAPSPFEQPDTSTWTWGDFGDSIMGMSYGIAAGSLALARQLNSDPAKQAELAQREQEVGAQANYWLTSRTPGSMRERNAPFLSSDWFKGLPIRFAEQIPALTLMMMPGGLWGKAAGKVAAVVASGELSAGDAADQIYSVLDSVSTDDFIKGNPDAQKLVAGGMDPEAARAQVTNGLVGMKPVVAGLIGAAAAAITLRTPGAGSRLGRVATGVGTGAAAFGAQGFTTAEMVQDAFKQSMLENMPDVNVGDVTLESAITGGILGAPMGLGKARPRAPRPSAAEVEALSVIDEKGVSSETAAAIDASKPPSAPGPATTSPTVPSASAEPGAGDPRKRLADAIDALEAARATGEDTTALEAEVTAARTAVDALPPEAPPVAPAPETASGAPPVAPEAAPAPPEPEVAATPESNAPEVRPEDFTMPPGVEPPPPAPAPEGAPPAPEAAPAAPVPAPEVAAPSMTPPRPEAPAPAMEAAPALSETPAEALPEGVGPAGARAIQVRKPRVLKVEMTPEQKAADEASRKARKAEAQRARRAEAKAAREAVGEETGVQPPAPSKKSKAEEAAQAARTEGLRGAYAKIVPEKMIFEDKPTLAAHVAEIADAVRAATAETGGPRQRVSKVAHGIEAFGADTVALDNAFKNPKMRQDRLAKQAKEYLGRLETAKGGDFTHWKSVRKAEAEQNKRGRGGAPGGVEAEKTLAGQVATQEGVAEPIAEAVTGRGTGQAEKFEAPPAKPGRVLSAAEKAAHAKRLGLPVSEKKAEVPKVTPGKEGITPGKTLPPKVAEVVEKVAQKPNVRRETVSQPKPAEPEPRSHEAVDQQLKEATANFEQAKKRLESAKGGGEKKVAAVAVAKARAALRQAEGQQELQTKLAEARAKRGDLRGTQEEIDKARRDLRYFTDERIATLRAEGRTEDLQNALERRADAHAVLELEDKPGTVQLGMGIGSFFRRRDPVDQLNHVLRQMRIRLGVPEGTHSHIYTDFHGNEHVIRSVIDSTVGQFMRDANVDRIAQSIFGLPSKEASGVVEHILNLARDVPMHFIGDFASDAPGIAPRYGAFVYSGTTEGRIVFGLREMAAHAAEAGDYEARTTFNRAVVHEALHASTVHAYFTDDVFRLHIDQLLDYARKVIPDDGPEKIYGLSKPLEFITEGLTNPEFHAMLRSVEAPESIVRLLGLDQVSPHPSLFDAFVGYLRQIFGLGPKQHTLFEGLVRSLERVTTDEYRVNMPDRVRGPSLAFGFNPAETVRKTGDFARRSIENVLDRPEPRGELGKVKFLKLATTDYIARASDRYFGTVNNPIRAIARAIEKIRVDSKRYLNRSLPLVDRMFAMERKVGPERWDEFATLLHDERHAGVFADKKLTDPAHGYLTKNGLKDVQGKARHAALHARWQALPQELKDLRADMLKHYTTEQNRTTLATIKNRLLKGAGIPLDKYGEALANRIFLDRMTEDDIAELGDLAKPLQATNLLKKVDGPYYPSIRRGDHVVSGRYRFADPNPSTGAQRVRGEDGTLQPIWEFGAGINANKAKARKDAMRYAASLPENATVRSVWVNEKTGSLYQEGEDVPVGQRVLSQDPNADHRFRVIVQDQHVEFAQGRKNANRRRNELAATGMEMDPVRLRRDEYFPRAGYLASQLRTIERSLTKRPGYATMTEEMKNDLRAVLREAALRLYSQTRIESRSLPFRKVQGAGREITKDLLDYSRGSSNRLAQLEHTPELDAALEHLATMEGDNHPQTYGRSAIGNEMRARVSSPEAMGAGKNSPWVNRVMGLSFSSHLASPSYTLINLTQNPMLTFPILAAKHGPFKAMRALQKAYGDIGAGRQLRKGLGETGRAIAGKETSYDYLTDIRGRLRGQELELIDRAIEAGALDPEVGLETAAAVDRSNPTTPGGQLLNAVDSSLNWMQAMARHLPRAAEVLNRLPALLATYRLERARGVPHETAVEAAIDIVNQTQFNYAHSNKAPFFNKPTVRLLTQFRQYPIHVTQMMAEQLAKAWHNTNPGDRAEAVKAMGYLIGTHAAMAGALGLATEPFKLMVITLGMLGVPMQSWQEIEDMVRQGAAGALGEFGGRLVTKGLPAALGVDPSASLGANNLFTYGTPDSYTWKDATMWILEQGLGAPLGESESYLKGFQDIANGEYLDAAKEFSPIKALTNMVDAGVKLAGGKTNVHGRQTAPPYSVGEAVVRAFGFRPTSETERDTAKGLFAKRTAGYRAERQALLDSWAAALPSQRGRMWGEIERWNKGRDPTEKLTRAWLDDYVRQRSREVMIGGVRMGGPADKARMREIQQTYGQ